MYQGDLADYPGPAPGNLIQFVMAQMKPYLVLDADSADLYYKEAMAFSPVKIIENSNICIQLFKKN